MPCRIARLNYTIFHGLVLVFGTSVHVSTISSFVTFLLSSHFFPIFHPDVVTGSDRVVKSFLAGIEGGN